MLRVGLFAFALMAAAGFAAPDALAQAQPQGKPAKQDAKQPAAGKPAAKPDPKQAAATPGDENKEQTAWVKLCEKAPSLVEPKNKDEPRKELNICLTHHERLDGNTGMVLVSAALRQVEGQEKQALMVMVPLGMALPPGVQVKVDENEPVKLQFTICHAAGCTAETEATAPVLDQMKKGKQIVVAAINLAGKAIGFPVPLNGFDKAYAGQPVDNEKYKEARKKLMVMIAERQRDLIKKAREEAEKKKQEGGDAAQPAPAAAKPDAGKKK